MPKSQEIISLINSPSKQDIDLIQRAHNFAKEAHKGQVRYSGEPYFHHLHETAKNLAYYGMQGKTIAAGLLHDSIEDKVATEEEIRKEFGEEILFLINGVTKLGTLKYKGVKRHVESLRKLFIAMSEDIRVLIIKLTDRLHNMQTLEHVPKEKQERIALETLEIYAPLAYRLGIRKLSKELEDLAFKILHPKEYEEMSKTIKEKAKKDTEYLKKISKSVKKALAKEKITIIKTNYRVKGHYSFYKKIQRKEGVEKIYDTLALRIIVGNIGDCYKTLGIIHSLWRPMPGRIKDFIAFPKPNGYQSLQTTVFTGDGGLVEIQIRTEEMHKEAEYGVAAHSIYKGEKMGTIAWIKNLLPKKYDLESQGKKAPEWVKELKKYQEDYKRPNDFIKNLKQDFFQHRIFTLTPNGDVIDLPEGSSPIDFAYAIHSDIGNYISGVKINNKMGSLDTKLENGDIVEIMTKKSFSPTQKWLKLVKTNLAKRHIRIILGKKK